MEFPQNQYKLLANAIKCQPELPIKGNSKSRKIHAQFYEKFLQCQDDTGPGEEAFFLPVPNSCGKISAYC